MCAIESERHQKDEVVKSGEGLAEEQSGCGREVKSAEEPILLWKSLFSLTSEE